MYSVWVQLEVLPGQRDEFLRAIATNAEHSVRDEPGCLFFDVIELDREAGRYAFYEIYRDRHAFVAEHRSATHYARWREVSAVVIRPDSHTNTEGSRILGTPLPATAPAEETAETGEHVPERSSDDAGPR